MKVLVITDGLYNNYSCLDEMSFENDELYVFVSHQDRNKIDTYFKEKYDNVTIVKRETDIKGTLEKVLIFRIHEKSKTPYESFKRPLDKVTYHSSPQLARFRNFREVKLQTIENTYKELGLENRDKEVKQKIKQRIKKMKSKAKNPKPKKESKPIVRVSLKAATAIPLELSLERLCLETYD